MTDLGALAFADDYPEDYQERYDAMLDAADQMRKQRKENPDAFHQRMGSTQEALGSLAQENE